MTTYYMHTLDGRPAYFDEDDRIIYYITKRGTAGELATSLRQIYREQRIDRRENSCAAIKYGHVRVRVPDLKEQDRG